MTQKNKLKKKKGKPTPVNFQDTILNLQKFWGNYGCVILQPYDIEVGAGTFHPATTLRSLGFKNHGKQHMSNLHDDLQMVGMGKIQIVYNNTINFR